MPPGGDNSEPTQPVQPPKAVAKKAPPGFNSAQTLERLDKAEGSIKNLQKGVKEVQETNRLIIVVLFVGFLTLLFAVIGMGIDAWRVKSDSEDQLNTSIQQLQSTVENLRSQSTTTPTTATSTKAQ